MSADPTVPCEFQYSRQHNSCQNNYDVTTYGELQVVGCNVPGKERFVLKRSAVPNEKKYDVFQIGKKAPGIDFVIKCQGSRSSVSRYACHIIAENANTCNVRIYAGAHHTDGPFHLNRNAVKWEDGESLDGFTKNGLLLLHPSDNGTFETSVWREVSCKGKIFSLRETRSSANKGMLVECASNTLKDWSLIDLCGVTLLFRTPEGLKKSPSEGFLKKLVSNANLKRSVDVDDQLVIPRCAPSKSSAAICFECGCLQGNVLTLQCQSCNERRTIQSVTMGMQRVFYRDDGTHTCSGNLCAISPCGHLTSEITAK